MINELFSSIKFLKWARFAFRGARVFWTLTVIPILVFTEGSVFAAAGLSQCDLDSIYKNTVWYQPCNETGSDSSLCGVNVDVDLNGNDNIQKGYNFFVKNGFSAEQSAGLIGNFRWESGMDPTNTNSSGAHGIAQWLDSSGSPRRTGLTEFAQKIGQENEDDLAVQLQYVLYEFRNGEQAAAADLKAQTTVEGATGSVFYKYERAGDSTLPDRVKLAQEVFDQYRGAGADGSVGVPPGSDGCASTGPGQDTKYLDGFTVYSQYDSAWKDKPYSSSTIGDSGCGPSAMAMIITALTGKQVTPVETANYAASQGLYIPGAGSSWSIAPVLAAHWGLNAIPIGSNIDKITATLQSGGLVITSGQGPLPFTSGGHYLVIRGATADGKWLIGDSAHSDTSDQPWDPQQLVTSMNDGSVYAISK